MNAHREERSIGDLFTDLTRDITTLFRQEVSLAQAEIKQNITDVGRNSALMVIGSIVAYSGFLGLLAALILLLGLAMPWWVAALIVGAIVLAIGAGLMLYGQQKIKESNVMPQRAVDTMRDTTNQIWQEVSR
jgi:hypothetical protein